MAISRVTIMLAETGPWTVVTVRGELDIATAPELERRIEPVLATQGPPLIALELSRLGFCDSSGLGLLVRLWKRVQQDDGRMVLVQVPEHLSALLQRTGLDRLFTCEDTLPSDPG